MTEPNDPASAPLVPAAMLHALTVAHAEIDRLRSLTRFQDGVIRSGDTACLTQAERDALLDAAEVCDSRERRAMEFQLPQEAEHWRCLAATIRGLSERLSGTQEKSIREDCHK